MIRPIAVTATLLLLTTTAQAALFDRGGGFIYDDVLDVTWTQSANLHGLDYYTSHENWAYSLEIYDPVRDVTWDDWRLARMNTLAAEGAIVDCSTATEVDCRTNEMGYLFWQYGITTATPGPFTDLEAGPYLSATIVGAGPAIWVLNYTTGATTQQYFCDCEGQTAVPAYAWAVRDGDVGVVPLPAAGWLLGSGLGVLGWWRRRRGS